MSTKTSPLMVKVKKEAASDEIKDFAETAMNELLGWYGYENVDRSDLTRYAGRMMASNKNEQSTNATTITLRPNSRIRASTMTATATTPTVTTSAPNTPPSRSATTTITTTRSTPERHTNNSSPESSSRYSKSPGASVGARSLIGADEKKDIECGWCKRPVSLSSPDFLNSPEGPRYCTESCFSQSRRASFKRAKTCDWCKHVRHAVSYVDFQDGASQLQFCSDKCLNQYKMQIFCKETQAHLDMNPHLLEKGDAGSEGTLITPDLWLKNCKSRSTSPLSERSRSRSPATLRPHKPIITLAPSSKLLSRPTIPAQTIASRVSPRSARKRRTHRPSTLRNEPIRLNHLNNAIKPTTSTTTSLQDLTTNAQHRNISNHTLQTIQKEIAQKTNNPNHQFLPPPPNLYPLRSPTGNSPVNRFPSSSALSPSLPPINPKLNTTGPPSFQQSPTDTSAPKHHPPPSHAMPHPAPTLFGANPPPITILVPYPIMVPIPFPVPIPMPIIAFLRAAQVQLDAKNKAKNETPASNESYTHLPEQPLDCTKTRDLCDDDDPELMIEVVCEDSSDIPQDNEDDPPPPATNNHQPPKRNDPQPTETPFDLNLKNTNNSSGSHQVTEPHQQQPLPKFKITRLNSRRGIITPSTPNDPTTTIAGTVDSPSAVPAQSQSAQPTLVVAPAKESPPILETSRPLRKRKRLVDCDYARVKDDDSSKMKKTG